jgi:hypothetical protein
MSGGNSAGLVMGLIIDEAAGRMGSPLAFGLRGRDLLK